MTLSELKNLATVADTANTKVTKLKKEQTNMATRVAKAEAEAKVAQDAYNAGAAEIEAALAKATPAQGKGK